MARFQSGLAKDRPMNNSETGIVMGIKEIEEILPHRFPFLLVDRVVELIDNERIVSIKNLSINEWFFQGHFPGRPLMPGVLILEAMAQTAAILAKKSTNGVGPDKLLYLVGLNDVKFRREVVPGDTLRVVMQGHKHRKPLWSMKGEAFVGDQLVAMATVNAAEVE